MLFRSSFSVAFKNIVSGQNVAYTDSEVPTYNENEELRLESVYSLEYMMGDFSLYGQMKIKNKDQRMLRNAAVNYNPSFIPFFSISLGYKEDMLNRSEEGVFEKAVKSGFTLGIGLDLFGVGFDYAFEQSDHVEFNSKHYFSIGLDF